MRTAYKHQQTGCRVHVMKNMEEGTHAGDTLLWRTDRLTGWATGLPAKSCMDTKKKVGEEGIRQSWHQSPKTAMLFKGGRMGGCRQSPAFKNNNKDI